MRGLVLYGQTGKFTWRMLATVLVGQSLCVFFGALVARGIAASGDDASHSTAYLLVGSGLALLCIVGAGALRRPWGVTLGWFIQVATLASAVVVPMMFFVGLIFLALWVTCLVQGGRVDEAQARQALDADGEGPSGDRPAPDGTTRPVQGGADRVGE
ncbi:hypothetical protein N865_18060 [Intrasporangium oryzae NRRL B-24470]|uniref:DUF4233 domain-containing protein n=1 Tax=Intrasporangium oryzae NRRL B-24470 TaxID=1386089 RepID=W9G5M6_9MICO|nr:DUF4233 domain-containing protein [Intrasporangium oryzae]EWT00083.1 hypothetical protein N865_18060 [Intrasporangium oryzae NRRL B-24470]